MTTETVFCKDVGLRVGYRPLLKNVNFSVVAQHALALTGPNGIGKTTLLRSLAGVARPYTGEVRILGMELWPKRSVENEALAVYLASHPALLLDLSVEQNLRYMCAAFGVSVLPQELTTSLERVDLQKRELQNVRTLSTGQKRRLTLAGLLLIKPKIVFADEPTNGLDFAGTQLCLNIFDELMQKNACSIVTATHDTRLVEFCNQDIDVSQFVPIRKQRTVGVAL